jgi:hypothetical protein
MLNNKIPGGDGKKNVQPKRGPAPKLQQQIERQRLPKAQQLGRG